MDRMQGIVARRDAGWANAVSMTSETELDHLRRLRAEMERKAEGPPEPDHLVEAGRRLSDLRERMDATSDAVERYALEREMLSISQAIVPEVRALERERRASQREAREAREALQQAALEVYEERRRAASARVRDFLAEASRELAALEALRVELEEEFELTSVSAFKNSHLARLLGDAERARASLGDDSTA